MPAKRLRAEQDPVSRRSCSTLDAEAKPAPDVQVLPASLKVMMLLVGILSSSFLLCSSVNETSLLSIPKVSIFLLRATCRRVGPEIHSFSSVFLGSKNAFPACWCLQQSCCYRYGIAWVCSSWFSWKWASF